MRRSIAGGGFCQRAKKKESCFRRKRKMRTTGGVVVCAAQCARAHSQDTTQSNKERGPRKIWDKSREQRRKCTGLQKKDKGGGKRGVCVMCCGGHVWQKRTKCASRQRVCQRRRLWGERQRGFWRRGRRSRAQTSSSFCLPLPLYALSLSISLSLIVVALPCSLRLLVRRCHLAGQRRQKEPGAKRSIKTSVKIQISSDLRSRANTPPPTTQSCSRTARRTRAR